MIGFYAAGAMGSGGGPVPPGSRLVGITYATGTQSGASMTLAVPAGATSGDTLIWISIIRGDRTISVPMGWTAHRNIVLNPSHPSSNQRTRFAALSKAYSGETNVSVGQSANAAWGGALIVARGTIQQDVLGATGSNSASASITTTGACTLIGVLAQHNISPASPPPAAAPATGWAYDGVGYYDFSGELLYMPRGYSRDVSGAVNVSLSPSTYWGTHAGRAGAVWIAEIQ